MKTKLAIRFALLGIGLASALIGVAQSLGAAWGDYSDSDWSYFTNGAFLPGDKTIFVRHENAAPVITCKGPDGITLWNYTIGQDEAINSTLATNDNFIYLSGQRSTYGNDGYGFVLALHQDGSFAWKYVFDKRADLSESLGEMRIFGGSILVCGYGKPTTSGPEPSTTILSSIDRFTGSENYVQGFMPGGIAASSSALRAAGGNAFLLAEGPYPTYGVGVYKIDPTTGSTIGSFIDLASGANDIEVDSAGGIYLCSNSFRRINGSGAGTFPVVYSRPITGWSMAISGGSMYLRDYDTIRKVNLADGITIWLNTYYRDNLYQGKPDSLAIDSYGRVILSASDYWYGGWAGEYWLSGSWWLQTLDPRTGALLNKVVLGSSYDEFDPYPSAHGGFVMGPYGEIIELGAFVAPSTDPNGYGDVEFAEAARFFQQPEPAADTYTCFEGSTLTTAGSGVLANDKYVNPARCTASLVTPPAHGALTMTTDGEFTYNAAGVPIGTEIFTYRVTRGSLSATAQARIVISRGLANLTLVRTTLAGQNATLGTVTLSSTGPAATVTLSDDSSLISEPSSVVVPNNQLSANFGVNVLPVSIPVVTQIKATYAGSSKTVTLNLTPLVPTAISLTPSTVIGGNTVSVRVVINGVAGTGGKLLAISDNSVYCVTPPNVTVPSGASSVTFNVTTTHPATPQIAKITAAVTAGSATATLRINP